MRKEKSRHEIQQSRAMRKLDRTHKRDCERITRPHTR